MKSLALPVLATALLVAALPLQSAHATLTLTQAAIDDGFKLSLFASGFAPLDRGDGPVGPLGVATTSAGKIIVYDYGSQAFVTFNDANNQTYSQALSSVGFANPVDGTGLTSAGGLLYAVRPSTTTPGASDVVQIDNSGNVVNVLAPGVAKYGLATRTTTGHIISSGADGIYDIDPATGNARLITTTTGDGVSVTPDGKTVYVALGSISNVMPSVMGFDIDSGLETYRSSVYGPADGTGVIQGVSQFAGDLVANGNDGTLNLLDPTDPNKTIIELANSGSRGDYVGLDQNDGSLLITQSDSIYRLSCTGGSSSAGCDFVAPVSLPEPSSILPFGLGLLGLLFIRQRTGKRPG